MWTLMHESIHLNSGRHPDDFEEPYSAHPFNRVRLDAGDNTCLK